MNILVIGCGKVGAQLACALSNMGHDVAMIDAHAETFDLLDDDFSGFTIAGVPIDMDVLRQAGIEGCDVLAAVSQDDNINVMVSQLAKEIFKVPKVITRIFDPRRKEVFSQFGLHTICQTSLTVDALISSIDSATEDIQQITFESASITLSTIRLPKGMAGKPSAQVLVNEEESFIGVLHYEGQITLVTAENRETLLLKESDRLIIARVVD